MDLDRFFWLFYVYFLAHLCLYLVALRHLRSFAKERVIFLYHLLPGLALGSLIASPWMVSESGEKLQTAVGFLSFHGVYSLSFLELWWLSDGGYSLRILDCIHRADENKFLLNFSVLQELGSVKKQDRLDSLRQLGLVTRREEKFQLTPFGKAFVAFLYLVQWPSNMLRTE